MLAGQVERQMKASIKAVADLWYTCWINAGQPDLSTLTSNDNDLNDTKEQKENLNESEIRPETHLIINEMNACANHHCCESKEEYLLKYPKHCIFEKKYKELKKLHREKINECVYVVVIENEVC